MSLSKRQKRKRLRGPRRKRMKREDRLQSARSWIAQYAGKNIVRSYSRWYGVDLLCAVRELRMLGINIDEEREKQLKATIAGRVRARQFPLSALPFQHASVTANVPSNRLPQNNHRGLNPQVRNLFDVISLLQQREGVQLEIHAARQ